MEWISQIPDNLQVGAIVICAILSCYPAGKGLAAILGEFGNLAEKFRLFIKDQLDAHAAQDENNKANEFKIIQLYEEKIANIIKLYEKREDADKGPVD